MDEPLGAGEDLHEGAEVHRALDDAEVELADLGLLGELADDVYRLVGGALVRAGDLDAAAVVHLDAGARAVLD
ncbi:MAG: hypothetical protein ACK56I_13430, partial [bacterium]